MKKKRFISLMSFMLCLVLGVGSVGLFTTGCPSKSSIQKAVDASEQLEAMTATAISTANFAVADNLISSQQNAYIAPKLAALQKGARAFRNAAEEFKATYKGESPPDKVAVLSTLFSTSVVAPFLEVLQDLKLLRSATKVIAAVGVIRLAILQISQVLGKKEAVAEIRRYDPEFEGIETNYAYS